MKITYSGQQAVVEFQSCTDLPNDFEKQQEADLNKFIKPSPYFHFPQIINPQIEKFKKKVIAFAIQYGQKNEKTTSIFLNFLQYTRELATNYLRNKQYSRASTFYAQCLGFIEPDDQVFTQKFVTIKIDIANKLVHSILQLQKSERPEIRSEWKLIDGSYSFMEQFISVIEDYPFYKNLVKSEKCLIELNYFYAGKLHKKKKNTQKAIQNYQKVLDIISQKLNNKTFSKNQNLIGFLYNLKIKADYKISKCFRQIDDKQNRKLYEGIALKSAKQTNKALYLYISRKIRFYQKKNNFQSSLHKLEGKKKIEEEITKLIQESKQNNIQSLYDVYQDQTE